MNDKKTLITVVIPTHNHSTELQRAIISVLNQTWQNFEILVADDGSTEDIKTVCDSFNDERIRFIRNDEHTNANVARNMGIRAALGEYVAMLDADDEYLPNHLERRMKKIAEWGCDGIFGSAYVKRSDRELTVISRLMREDESMINYLLSDGFAPTPSHFYRTSTAKSVLWDETLERHQDFDFMVRFARENSVCVDPEPTIVVHWENHDKKDYKLDSCKKFISRNKEFIDKKIYNDYHKNMYIKIRDFEKPEYIEHYAVESYRYIEHVSLGAFYLVHAGRGYFIGSLIAKYVFLKWMHLLESIFHPGSG